MRRIALLCALVAALVIPVAGTAGEGTVQVSCNNVTFFLARFPYGTMDFTYTVTVDGRTVASGTQTQAGPESWLVVPISFTGNKTVTGQISWVLDGGGSVQASDRFVCKKKK